MKRTSRLFMLALVLIAPLQKQQVWTANIDQIRRVARMIPGGDPLRINVLKFAESRRAKKFSVKGAPDEPSVQARTVFQVVYADGYVMLDAGMDQQVHNFFGRGVVEPYAAHGQSSLLMNTATMLRESFTRRSPPSSLQKQS